MKPYYLKLSKLCVIIHVNSELCNGVFEVIKGAGVIEIFFPKVYVMFSIEKGGDDGYYTEVINSDTD